MAEVATERVELCRLVTCGSVDDGKSTLIGRLLYDSKQVMADQLAHVEEVSERRGDGYVNLALLTDGLRAEREQGITIDVAYRPFATPKRRFIIADCPGHIQYTRNMVTGASTADIAVILVDARHGVVEQTRRHAFICTLLRIPRVVVAVNKMDLVAFRQSDFDAIAAEIRTFVAERDATVEVIPISALSGDNVVDGSPNMPWYSGPTLLGYPETASLDRAAEEGVGVRFPVQWVIRPQAAEYPDYRGYAGQVAAGSVAVGADVVVLPGGHRTTVARIETLDGDHDHVEAPRSVTLHLADQIDVSRGDVIAAADDAPVVTRQLIADLCWMSERPMAPRGRYVIRHATREAVAIVESITHRVDIHTLTPESVESIGLNDIARVVLKTSQPLAIDRYERSRTMGSFILVDEATNDTLAAGMIAEASAEA